MSKILFPPHPDSRLKITPLELETYEESGKWLAQRKFNGTHILINISPEREITLLNRHGIPPKQFELTNLVADQLLSLDLTKGQEYWLAGELLDAKTTNSNYKNKIVLFDVLAAGRYFFKGPNQQERLRILGNICGNPKLLEPNDGIALQITSDIWLTENFYKNYLDRFRDFIQYDAEKNTFGGSKDEIEGLVLRRRDSVLDNFGRVQYDVSWMIRCRKPNKNYTF